MYKAGVNALTACAAWSTCPSGKGLSVAGTDSSDITCETCQAIDYQWSTENDRSACQDHAKCPPGQGSNFSSLTDAEKTTQASSCVPCDSTTYSTALGYGPCSLKKTACPAGELHCPADAVAVDGPDPGQEGHGTLSI